MKKVSCEKCYGSGNYYDELCECVDECDICDGEGEITELYANYLKELELAEERVKRDKIVQLSDLKKLDKKQNE